MTNNSFSENLNATLSTGLNGTESSILMIDALNCIDLTVRCVSSVIFLAYFLLVAWFKDQRTVNLFYVHHANFVNLIYTLIYLSFFNSTSPNLGSEHLNDIFCHLVEILFGLLKFLRSYSVLLIALYRLSAVYAIDFYRQLNNSCFKIILPVVIVWLLSLMLAISTKYASNTTYSQSLCLDGFSNEMRDSVTYMVVTSILSILVPFSFTLAIYYFIRSKLRKTRKTSCLSKTLNKENRREQRFASQILAINFNFNFNLFN